MLAGVDTTETFIRWAIVLLTNHVSIQERLHAEIDSVIGRQRLPPWTTVQSQLTRTVYVKNSVDLIDHLGMTYG